MFLCVCVCVYYYYYYFISFPHMSLLGGIVQIEAVTRRILWISSTNPAAKVLVFSSWMDVLDVLQHAFTANRISYVRMKGGR